MNYSLSRFTIVSSLVCLGSAISRAFMVMGKRREKKNYQSHHGGKECVTGQRLSWLVKGIFLFFNAGFMEYVKENFLVNF